MESPFMVKWIVPKVKARMAHLVWIDQRMVELGSVEEGFMEDKDIGGPCKGAVIGSSTRNNWNIEQRLHRGIISVDVCCASGVGDDHKILAKDTGISVGITLIVGKSVGRRFSSGKGVGRLDVACRSYSSNISLLPEAGLLIAATHDGGALCDLADVRLFRCRGANFAGRTGELMILDL